MISSCHQYDVIRTPDVISDMTIGTRRWPLPIRPQ